jgi:hypothetical protein
MGNELELPISPRLASWDAKTHPSQLRLSEYLGSVTGLVQTIDLPRDGLALALTVGLPEGTDLITGGRDLDNYLFPLAQHLVSSRFVSVWGWKRVGKSSVLLDVARPQSSRGLSEGWSFASARTTMSATQPGWKQEIASQIAEVQPAPDGPIELQVSFRVSPIRNWANLWKPALDSLEAVLGAGPWWNSSARDDRIVRLGLHRSVDPGMGNNVAIGIWWRAAPAQATV